MGRIETPGASQPSGPRQRDVIQVEFGTGDISGHLLQEIVCLSAAAGAAQPASATEDPDILLNRPAATRCVESGVVEALSMSDEPFQAFAFDGILGLGLDALALTPQFSFLSRLAVSVGDSSPNAAMFAVFLSKDDPEGDGMSVAQPSELVLGGMDPSRYSGPLRWAPVESPGDGYWQLKLAAVRIGNQYLGSCHETAA